MYNATKSNILSYVGKPRDFRMRKGAKIQLKVLHINTYENQGGAARAAYRIHEALLKEGVDSYYYALVSDNGGKRILYGKPHSKVSRGLWKLKGIWESGLEREIKSLYCNNIHVPISLGIGSMLNRGVIEELNPDVIHLHWICESFISAGDIKWLANKYPLVWTLHDTWAFTGGCHYNEECQKYKIRCEKCDLFNNHLGIDLAKKIFLNKKNSYARADIKVVGCSNWIADGARESALLGDKDVFWIPNTLNQEVYKLRDKYVVKSMIGLPKDKKMILFGAMYSTSDRRKGFQYLQGAIQYLVKQNLPFEFELMVFGSDEPENPPAFGVPIHYMGRFVDDLSLSMLYSAADVMLVPSMYENFPNTGLESMNCGTPVVSFKIGGLPDQIDHKVNGYLAEPYDSEDFARGIAYVLEDNERWQEMSHAARRKAEKYFNEKRIAREYMKVYEVAIQDITKI